MYSPTYSELKSALQKELDLEDETFITAAEFLNYFNEGVDEVEAEIHNIYEDYFLTVGSISLVSGTQDYSLPSDIFAQKIRKILYNDGASKRYPITRLKNLEKIPHVEATDSYQYLIVNTTASGLKIRFYPTPAETNSNVSIYYLRNAKRFSADADVCDIPEFTPVIIQYVRWKCLSKEGHPDAPSAREEYLRMKQGMVDTLTARVPDEDNTIEKDLSFYDDFDTWSGGLY